MMDVQRGGCTCMRKVVRVSMESTVRGSTKTVVFRPGPETDGQYMTVYLAGVPVDVDMKDMKDLAHMILDGEFAGGD